MTRKIAALMLPATALPFTEVSAHPVASGAPVTGYLLFMLGIGVVYLFFLLTRPRRTRANHKH